MMNSIKIITVSIFIILSLTFSTSADTSDTKIIENVELTYQMYAAALMTGDFNGAYGYLSSHVQKLINYDLFVEASIEMEKISLLKGCQLSGLKIKGKYAGAKSIIYLDFLPEKEGGNILSGKIEAPIYFIRENEKWKIATGEDSSIEAFLKIHPAARKLYQPFSTQAYYKQKGYWIGFRYKAKKDNPMIINQ